MCYTLCDVQLPEQFVWLSCTRSKKCSSWLYGVGGVLPVYCIQHGCEEEPWLKGHSVANLTHGPYCLLRMLFVYTGGASVVTALTGVNIYAGAFLIPVGVMLYTAHGGLKATFIAAWGELAAAQLPLSIVVQEGNRTLQITHAQVLLTVMSYCFSHIAAYAFLSSGLSRAE
jgi:hypothetical protein